MTRKDYLRFALVIVIVFGGMMFFLPPADRVPMGLSVGALLLFVMSASIPAVGRLVTKRPRATIGLGVVLILVSVLGMVAGIAAAPALDIDRLVAVSVTPMMMGIAIILLPGTVRRLELAKAQVDAAKADPLAATAKLSPVGDVVDALNLLFRERATVLKVIGPWFLAYCVLPIVFVDQGAWKGMLEHHLGLAVLLLISAIFVLVGLLFVATIQWIRFLGEGRAPSVLSVPPIALWGYFWRFTIYAGIFRVLGQFEPWLKAHMIGAAPWTMSGIAGLVGLSLLVLSSPWAMVLVPVALQAPDKSIMTARFAFAGAGRGVYLSILLILVPISVLSWVVNFVPKTPDSFSSQLVQGVAWALALFLTTTVAATFLARLYLRSPQSRLPVAAT